MSTETKIKFATNTKNQQVYEQLRSDILEDKFPPGTEMLEKKLCELYNVSRSPIRNALQRLVSDGLLSHYPGKGMIVKTFTTEDILEVYDLMELHQLYAIKKMIANPSEKQISIMKEVLDQQGEAIQRKDVIAALKADDRFHQLIIQSSHNDLLSTMFEVLNNQNKLCMTTIRKDFEKAQQSYGEHCQIYECILSGNEQKAEEVLRKHYEGIKRHYINKLLGSFEFSVK